MPDKDPKRTSAAIAKCDIGYAIIYERTELAHSYFSMYTERSNMVGSHERHRRSASHLRLQHPEQSASKPFPAFRFSDTDRSIEVAIGRWREVAQHSLNNHHMRFRCERSPQNIANNPAVVTTHYKRFLNYRVPIPIGCLANRQSTASLRQIGFLENENARNIVGSSERNVVLIDQFSIQH